MSVTTKISFRYALKGVLDTFGLLQTARTLRQTFMWWTSQRARDFAAVRQEQQRRAVTFSRRYADTFGHTLGEAQRDAMQVLVVGEAPPTSRIGVELCLIKALELSGCACMPVIWPEGGADLVSIYYRSLIQTDGIRLRDFCDSTAFNDRARSVLDSCRSLAELLDVRFASARVGGHAVSSTRRTLKIGALDLQAPHIRGRLIDSLAASMASATAATRIIEEIRPSLVLMEDTAYTPRGEILDTSAEKGIPVVRWFPAHKDNALMLKRYTSANRDHDLNSVSEASWRVVREMDWNSYRSEELKRELSACYSRGNWYSEAGTQFDKLLLHGDEIRHRLRLDPTKKTAFIFPHISWDASFGRGQDLFQSYDEWLVETVRAACANDKLQWVIKVHPAHVIKSHYDRRQPTEEEALRMQIGPLPPHISLLSADSEISTFSLFPVMDYCLTVRGTAGLEAACLGIPALTGGSGRYDRKGFTIDSATPQQYLERLARIQDVPRLSPVQVELAERYAYGLFLLRPLPLSSVTLEYGKKHGQGNFFSLVQINIRTKEDWEKAPDLKAFTEWATKSDEEDFLRPGPFRPGCYWENQRESLGGVSSADQQIAPAMPISKLSPHKFAAVNVLP
jgi:hypothetical protein